MSKPIINLDELDFMEFGKGDRFHAGRADVSSAIGAERLGYGVIRLKPGKRAWPYHSHYVIEEFFYIIEGEGTLRHAGEEFPVRQGRLHLFPRRPGAAAPDHQHVGCGPRLYRPLHQRSGRRVPVSRFRQVRRL